MSTERVIAQREIFQVLRDKICELVRSIKAGRISSHNQTGVDPDNKLGPLFSESSAQYVLDMLHEAKEAGASVLLGDLTRERTVIQPHVLTDVKPGSRIWDQETFGPGAASSLLLLIRHYSNSNVSLVIILNAADSVNEAVELANASSYSLTAALWTSNLYAAKDVASRIRSGKWIL